MKDRNGKTFTAYHATTDGAYGHIMSQRCVIPTRLPNVYLFVDFGDASSYCNEFCREWIVTVEIDSSQILSRWKPRYAPHGVIKLKAGENARVAEVQK